MQLHEELEAAITAQLDRLLTPALVIDLSAVEHNVDAMIRRCEGPGAWRPHVKTTKQRVVIASLLARGVHRFKCATVNELATILSAAEDASVRADVLVAYPLRAPAFRAVRATAARHASARVSVLADSPIHARELSNWAGASGDVHVFLDVDMGMNRTGVPPRVWGEAMAGGLGSQLPNIDIVGLHGYDGHHRWSDRDAAWSGYDRLTELALSLARPELDVVTSGTHSYAHALAHGGLRSGPWRHQVSPGTIVFSDLRSHDAADDLGLRQAAFVASRVVHVGDGRITLDAGSKGITPDGTPPTCRVVGWPGLEPQRASEEHLPVSISSGPTPELGALLWLIPDHVCTTVNLYRHAIWIREGRFAGHGDIDAASHPLWTDALEPA